MSELDLSIVIVNWHSADYVRACVDSLVAQTSAVSYEVVVVDNASYDDCEQQLARTHPGVVFVQSAENVGFGGANNLGARQSRGRVLLFLNPDTEVRDGAIDRLHAHVAGMSNAGVVGCRLLNTDGSLQTSCVQALPTVLNQLLDLDVLRRLLPRASLWRTEALFAPGSGRPVPVEAVSGACMMVRREVFASMGGFSPAFFMYGEDLDLCARVSRAGFTNAYAGDCEVVHHGGGSSRKMPSTFSVIMMCESVALLIRRSRGRGAGQLYRVALTIAASLRLAMLAVTIPLWLISRRTGAWLGAGRKWLAVLGWGLGLNRSVAPPPQKVPEGARG
jgi:N-acetylglucosaminyl-diphospho-decaprenol L-rhamnosyltransferase